MKKHVIMCVFPDHTLPFGIRIATAMKVEEETQPRLLGSSSPTPPHPTRKLWLLERSQVLAQVSSITPFANCSLLHGKPTGSGGSPTPEHPTAKCQQGRGTQGLGRQLEPSCSSCNAEASPCPSMNFQDCKTETSSSGAVRLGCSSPGGNTQLIFHPVLPRAVDPPVPGAREPCWGSHSHSLSPLGAL